MQPVTEAYSQILASGKYETEVKVVINNVEYDESWIAALEIESGVFKDDTLTIGGAYNSRVTLQLYSEEYTGQQLSAMIPRASEIRVYERLKGYVDDTTRTAIVGQAIAGNAVVGVSVEQSSVTDDWMLQGVFFVDTRDAISWTGTLEIEGLDRMALANAEYPGSQTGWPKSAYATVTEIAGIIGVQLDSTTVSVLSSHTYEIQWPTAYTMREILGYIAAMYCGNFLITKEGKLLLLAVNSLPEETFLLINEVGLCIQFGGDLILV